MKFLLMSLCIGCSVRAGLAQPYAREIESIPVTANALPVRLPWTGGISAPHYQFVDIDADGDQDLFVADRGNNGIIEVDFYRNEGSQTAPDFHLRPHTYTLPFFPSWFLFVDIDGDGKFDLFIDDGQTGMNYYHNDGTPQNPDFVLVQASMTDSAGNLINGGGYSIPAFADIDGDGRLDFFSGNVIGTVNYYRNISSPGSLTFRFVTDQWQNILIISGGPCGGYFRPADPTLHGVSAYHFTDIDADGDMDLLWGDAFASGLYFFRNQGTAQNPVMALEDTNCFPSNDPVVSVGGNQAALVDIDGDGDLDLFVAVGVASGAYVHRRSFLFYENTGSPFIPNFVKRTDEFISTLDVGIQASPAFVDIDGDGNVDLFVGNVNGELWFYRNTGSPTSPAFTLIDTSTAGVSGGFAFVPALVDIDNDSDRDLFVGRFDGTMRFYRNDGTPQVPQFTQVPSPVDTINVVYNNAPTFIDIDGDGDQDMFIGRNNGTVRFYRNTGDVSNFTPILENITYEGIIAGQNAKPRFVDIDGDGDHDLFIGTSEGTTEFYENTGTPQAASFVRRTNHYAGTDPMQEAVPAFVDIDGDGDQDLFVGTMTGGIELYRNELITAVPSNGSVPGGFALLQNYPNPFNPTTRIRFSLGRSGFVTLAVYDILGREVARLVNATMNPGSYDVEFTSSHSTAGGAPVPLASGMYLYRITVSDPEHVLFQQTRKLVLVR